MSASPPIITLITDFGLHDEFVGVVKGVMLEINRNTRIVDISHHIAPQDVRMASHLLARSYSHFPPDTVHLVVVDPGVGSSRHILAVSDGNHFFVGPDNGVLTPVLQKETNLNIHRVTNSELFLSNVSNTFHGRDIMAPVAALLASGFAIDKVGPRIDPNSCTLANSPQCRIVDDFLMGEISHVDRFGNLCTNIKNKNVDTFSHNTATVIKVGNVSIDTFATTYSNQKASALLVLYDSNGFLEIALNRGNAADFLKLAPGDPVHLKRR